MEDEKKNEAKDILKSFFDSGLKEVVTIQMGMLNSLVYRKKLMDFAKLKNISLDDLRVIIIMAGVMKNVDRLLEYLKGIKGLNSGEIIRALNCFSQYTKATAIGSFPFVNVPHSFPEIAILGNVWVRRDNLDEKGKTGIYTWMENTHFSQLNLAKDVQDMHKEWEKEFWTVSVTKTKNPIQDAFKKGFQEEFYDNKAKDSFMLLDIKGQTYNAPYSLDTLQKWAKKVASQMK
jgi:hypothetical protein